MARKLNFEMLDEAAEQNTDLVKARQKRWKRREADPSVQMSVRMVESVYERYRALCEHERRTNGEMLEIMLNHYIKTNN